jgi:hypothetical protein
LNEGDEITRRYKENTMKRIACITITLIAAVVCQATPAPAGITRQYVEDFTTTQFKDAINTTALWDTVAGELKLDRIHIGFKSSYDSPGVGLGIAVAGDYAFLADANLGLRIVSIANTSSIFSVGDYDTPGTSYRVALAGDHAFVADDSYGLQIIDISDPANPTLVGSYNTPGQAHDIVVDGDYAFIADLTWGMAVMDIDTLTAPRLITSYFVAGYSERIDVDGEYAYLANATSGLEIVDVSTPSSPSFLGSYDTPDRASDVVVDGRFLYVVDYGTGLLVFDVSDRTDPTLIGSYDTAGEAVGLAVEGDFAYVADNTAGLAVIDITDPTSPVLVDAYATPTAKDVAVAGDNAFVANYDQGMTVLDVAEPMSCVRAGLYEDPTTGQYDFAFSGDRAFAASGSLFEVYDISNPAAPSRVANLVVGEDLRSVAVAGDYAYAASATSGLVIFDIGDPLNPVIEGSYATTDDAQVIAIAGDYAFLGEGYYSGEFEIVDISDPATPTLVGAYHVYDRVYDVEICGDIAYVGYDIAIEVIDISDPSLPTEIDRIDVYGEGIEVDGDWLYSAGTYSAGYLYPALWVVDVSDPANAVYVAHLTPFYCRDVAVAGDYLLVTGQEDRFYRFDISDPTNPVMVDSVHTGYDGRYVSLHGDYAFHSGKSGSFEVLKIFDRWFDVGPNRGWSLPVDDTAYEIDRVRVNATHAGRNDWEFSADGGGSWTAVGLGSWYGFAAPGGDLLWRSRLYPTRSGVNPACTHLDVEWLFNIPVVETIADVAGDQGHRVRVTWARSGHDFVGDSEQILQYAVYRRYGSSAAPATMSAVAPESPAARLGRGGPFPRRSYPPGNWDFVVAVPADAQESYSVVVSTLLDSSIVQGMRYSTFFVSAMTATPDVYFDSPPDSGYSVDNLAPGTPQNLVAAYNTGSGNTLAWDESDAEDFDYFRIYRGTDPEFTPGPATLVHSTAATAWADPDYDGWPVYYKLTAVDFSGNESDAAGTEATTAAGAPEAPQSFALHANVPNPFNPTTTIRYDVPPGGGEVRIDVFDTAGRLVRTLVDGYASPGRKSVAWDGRDTRGRVVASGVYFARMSAPEVTQSRKMLLLK